MGILENVTGKIVETVNDKCITPKIEEIKSGFEQIKIEKEFKELFLQKYGEEPYYDYLDRYITVNNLINSLIDNAHEAKNQFGKAEFAERHASRFIDNYKNEQGISESTINQIFCWMFDFIFSEINSINPYSDDGKLLSNFVQLERENEFRETKAYDNVMSRFDDLEKLINKTSPQGFINSANNDEFLDCSNEVKEFVGEIEKIEKEYQKKYQFEASLSKYGQLLQSITIKLRGYPKNQTDELICMLYCNIALCHANLGNKKEALESLDIVEKSVSEKNKRYHFVYAYVLADNDQNYEEAILHLDKALDIDENYHRAYFFRQYLYAVTDKQGHKSNINDMDAHFKLAIKDVKDAEWLSDFYMYRGLANLAYDDAKEAANDFKKAEEHEYNKTIAKLNYYAALYQQVVSEFHKEWNCYSVNFGGRKLNTIIAGLKPIIEKDDFDSSNYSIRLRILKLYVSSCSLLGVDYKLSPISVYIEKYNDYELRRLIILNSRQKISDKEMQLLNDDDALHIKLRNLMNSNPEECKKAILTRLKNENIENPLFVYYFLQQACIVTKDSENYWKYKKNLLDNGINEEAISSMDACMYTVEENIQEAKRLFDKLVNETRDYIILENAIRFYKTNSFLEEAENVILKTLELFESSEIGIENVYRFYYDSISFFVSIKNSNVQELLDRIDQNQVTKYEYLKLQAQVFVGINDLDKLLGCLKELYEIGKNYQILFNLAICKFQLMKYDDAISTCNELLQMTLDKDQLLKIYWLLSDSYLLKSDFDNSYSWAEKTHNLREDIPGDRTHQAFVGRAIRCGHFEWIGKMAEYQRMHPIVVNYFKVVHFNKSDDGILESLKKATDEFSSNSRNMEQEERDFSVFYRKNPVTINLLLYHFNGDWQGVFNFSKNNKLKICDGDREKQNVEANIINDDLVLDANTLVILSYYKGLSLLSNIKNVHINYSTINTLQHYYMAYGYKYIKDILMWIEEMKNIVIEADGYCESESTISQAFSDNFTKTCNIARDKDIPFLCADMYADILKISTQLREFANVKFISIPAFYDFVGNKSEKLKQQALYKILSGASFVSFSANTIITAIEENDCQSMNDCISPFLICKSDYDMDSFSKVYLGAINHLSKECEDEACQLAEIILENTKRVWRRGQHYRDFEETDLDARSRSKEIKKYVASIAVGINKILGNKERIVNICNEILFNISNQ